MGICASIIPKAVGIRFKYEGQELIPPSGAVWVGNYVNNFDPMAALAIAPHYLIALEKAAHFKWFVYGPMVRRYGNLPVGSGKSDVTIQSMNKAEALLRAGNTSLMVFPEGTRSRNGKLGRFRKGAFVLAIRAGVPICRSPSRAPMSFMAQGPICGRDHHLQVLLPWTPGATPSRPWTILARKVRLMIEQEVFGPVLRRRLQSDLENRGSSRRANDGRMKSLGFGRSRGVYRSTPLSIDLCRHAEQAVVDDMERQGFIILEWNKQTQGPADVRVVKHRAARTRIPEDDPVNPCRHLSRGPPLSHPGRSGTFRAARLTSLAKAVGGADLSGRHLSGRSDRPSGGICET